MDRVWSNADCSAFQAIAKQGLAHYLNGVRGTRLFLSKRDQKTPFSDPASSRSARRVPTAPTENLQDVPTVNTETRAAEVQKARGKQNPLRVAQAKALKDEHARSVRPLQALAAEARQLERRVAELVNAACRLTAAEVALLWRTAPPRMPGEPPGVCFKEKGDALRKPGRL